MEDKIYAITLLAVLTVFFAYRKKSARQTLYELIRNPVSVSYTHLTLPTIYSV